MLDYARGYDVDRLLQVFRANAGLDTLGAVAPGGWEGLDGTTALPLDEWSHLAVTISGGIGQATTGAVA
jgi:hypothetical protein